MQSVGKEHHSQPKGKSRFSPYRGANRLKSVTIHKTNQDLPRSPEGYETFVFQSKAKGMKML